MVTVMVMVILNCMLSWLPSGDGHIQWSYEMVILNCPRLCDCHSNELLSWRSGHGHGYYHDHCVNARRNGEFFSNGDNRRSDHLLKTRMHFVKGPPHHLSCKLWNWFGPLCHSLSLILVCTFQSTIQYNTVNILHISATWYDNIRHNTVRNILKCVPFSKHTLA